jgi:hypothetical protein
MALVWADCVADTSTTTGTGALTVSGTSSMLTGQTFSDVCSTDDTFYYRVQHQTEVEWEEGLGTYSALNTVTRTTVIKSSNSDAEVDFAAGTKDVFIVLPSSVISAIIRSDATAVLTAGYTATPYDAGTKSSGTFTPSPADGTKQRYINGGAHTLAPQTGVSDINIEVTNNASAGAVTVSGYDKVVGTFDTTDTHVFDVTSRVGTSKSILYIQGIF